MINTKTLIITDDMKKSINEIDALKETVQKDLEILEKESQKALFCKGILESVDALLHNGNSSIRNEEEANGYGEAMREVFLSEGKINHLTEDYIKQLHHHLLKYSKEDLHHCGKYKMSSSNDVALLMSEDVSWMRKALETRSFRPLVVIAIFIIAFLEIRPFQDGNVRLSGVLAIFLLHRAGYTYVKYSSWEMAIEENRKEYYQAFCETRDTIRTESPDWQPWIECFLRILKQQHCNLDNRTVLKIKKSEKMAEKIVEHFHEKMKDHREIDGKAYTMNVTTGFNLYYKYFEAIEKYLKEKQLQYTVNCIALEKERSYTPSYEDFEKKMGKNLDILVVGNGGLESSEFLKRQTFVFLDMRLRTESSSSHI